MTTKNEIMSWFKRGIHDGKKWMIIIADTFSYENYPFYCDTREQVDEKCVDVENADMTRIMEVYNLTASRDYQISLPVCRADRGTV